MSRRLRQMAHRLKCADLAIARVPEKTADPFYSTPEWRALRKACLERDGYRCTVAGCNRPGIVADHIVSRKAGGDDKLGNLRALCRLHDNGMKERGIQRARPEGV